MALSFLGHSPSFEIWVFNVNGREFVARNFSTPSPLQLKFAGVFDKYSGSAPLIKTSGFNITDSTDKVVVWTWAGKQYTSWWMAESDDIDDPDANTTLQFGPAVPYSGPPVAPVGSGVTNTQSPPPDATAPPLPIDTGLVSEFRDAIDNANRSLAVSEAQRKVDINALNLARIEIEESKRLLAEAQSKATRDQEVLLAQMTEKVQEMQERAEVQINIARQMMAAQQTPPSVSVGTGTVPSPVVTTPPPAPVSTGTIPSPVVTTPTAPTAPASTIQPDWVKLGLQLGAAYLLLS
jgi:hypothetical protein